MIGFGHEPGGKRAQRATVSSAPRLLLCRQWAIYYANAKGFEWGWDWSARCGSVNIDLLICLLALDLTPAHSPKMLALKSVVHFVLAIDPLFDFTSQSPLLWCSGALQPTGVRKGVFFSFKTCRTSHTLKGHLEDKSLLLQVERQFLQEEFLLEFWHLFLGSGMLPQVPIFALF